MLLVGLFKRKFFTRENNSLLFLAPNTVYLPLSPPPLFSVHKTRLISRSFLSLEEDQREGTTMRKRSVRATCVNQIPPGESHRNKLWFSWPRTYLGPAFPELLARE